MLRRVIVGLALVAAVALPSVAHAQKIVFLVRHAERADEPARDQKDPALSAAGEARAVRLSSMLERAGIGAIYVSEYKRTQDTAAPLAAKLKVKPEMVPANTAALVAAMRAGHANDNVLIVGHTSTIPAILKALSGVSLEIPESDYGNLIVVVPATRAVSTIRF